MAANPDGANLGPVLVVVPPAPHIPGMADNPACPRIESGGTQIQETEDLFDYSKLEREGGKAMKQAVLLLLADFRMLSCPDIKWALNALKGHYALTRKTLSEALKKWQESGDPSGKRRRSRMSSQCRFIDFQFEHGSVKFNRRMFLLENERHSVKTQDATLEASVQRELRQWAEHESQLIECGCCYGEFVFEKMTQCLDGHLFCKECLVKYAQEAVFGSGRSELSCMEGGCTCSYPVRELEKVLPEKILRKYNERQAEEAVAAACGDELVRCPSCNFPALLDKDELQFSCPNPQCRKESCRKCHAQWKLHVGKTCKQVTEMDIIRTRVLFEERMTSAWLRKCVKCGTAMVKSQGCNHMTCRCGSHMCYVCRKQMGGKHSHVFCKCSGLLKVVVGGVCTRCGKCSLSGSPNINDNRIIKGIKKEAEAELSKKGPLHSRKRVGPPLYMRAKKVARRA